MRPTFTLHIFTVGVLEKAEQPISAPIIHSLLQHHDESARFGDVRMVLSTLVGERIATPVWSDSGETLYELNNDQTLPPDSSDRIRQVMMWHGAPISLLQIESALADIGTATLLKNLDELRIQGIIEYGLAGYSLCEVPTTPAEPEPEPEPDRAEP